MGLPKGYRPREGDMLILQGSVKYDFDEGEDQVWIILDGDFMMRRIPLEKVYGVIGRAWRVGDCVRSRNDHSDRGEVVAVSDLMVWVKHRSGSFLTYSGLDLEDDPMAEAPPANRPNTEVRMPGEPMVELRVVGPNGEPIEPDTSDIPEAGPEFFENAKLGVPDRGDLPAVPGSCPECGSPIGHNSYCPLLKDKSDVQF